MNFRSRGGHKTPPAVPMSIVISKPELALYLGVRAALLIVAEAPAWRRSPPQSWGLHGTTFTPPTHLPRAGNS